ncbi:fumarylacetoacetate hydrolase family protein [Cohnella panacarvi]|uniref:fumarylacetoacetate hydrolase family protein n=1 Tax=Cohnella panacarvi TaxID=400776 RepID=UPI00047AC7D5|nr:fumarylacetoacetate hydrolase family protein [Cohnella panacarvi]
MDIRNIYCVGRNYRLHAEELGNEVPASPMLFTKPTHAIASMESGSLVIPTGQGAVHYEAELVFAVGRAYEPGMRPDDLITHFTVGLDLTLRDVQETIKKKGLPWLPAKGFRNSAVLGRWLDYPGLDNVSAHAFGLRLNGAEAQRGLMQDMVFGLQRLIDFTGSAYGLGAGDLLFTGTPAGVGALSDGDELEVWWNEDELGRATVKTEG